jgi:hypothetical protein
VLFFLLVVPLLVVMVAACGSDSAADSDTGNPVASATATPAHDTPDPAERVSGQTEQQRVANTDDLTATIAISETQAAPESALAEETASEPTIGDAVQVGSLVITVTDVSEPPLADVEPADGSRFVVVDIAIANRGGEGQEDQVISSLLQMSLRDATGQHYTPTLNASLAAGAGTLQTPDAVLVAGEETVGRVGFEVPVPATDLVFVFDPLAEAEETVAIKLALP